MSQNGIYSFKSDLYSLGCIMYELATGVVPFYDNDINTLVKKIMNSNYDKRPLLVYSIDFSNIVNALLEKDPNKRPGWGDIEKFPFWDLEDTNNNSNNKININF
jgi:serine/threonine protein kinase